MTPVEPLQRPDPYSASTDQGPEWHSAPPAPGNHGVWVKLLTPLMVRPGDWKVVKTFDSLRGAERAVTNLNLDRVKKPAGRWEFTSRMNRETGTSDLYACYRGE